jgi:hemerythrin-like domain-containing protein
MSTDNEPGFSEGLKRIHSVFTRAIAVSIEFSREYSQKGFPDPAIQEGFTNYIKSFVSLLNSHHLTEDDLAFPYFMKKFPHAPYGRLAEDHHYIVGLLDQIQSAAEAAALGDHTKENLAEMNRLLINLQEVWHPHIHVEEADFDQDKVNQAYSHEEQAKMNVEFAEHSTKNSGPDYLVLPFMLYNLAPDDRTAMERELPPIVSQQLIPIAWKEQWKSMQPFLLPE